MVVALDTCMVAASKTYFERKEKLLSKEELPFETDSGIVNVIFVNLNGKTLLRKSTCCNFEKIF